MKIYIIGEAPKEELSQFDLIPIDYKFNDYKHGDVLIINQKMDFVTTLLGNFQKKLKDSNLIVINLTNDTYKITDNYYCDVKSLSLLLDTIVNDNYFEYEGVPLRYKYIDKGHNQTLVVLQSSGIKWTDCEMYEKHSNGEISDIEYERFVTECHRRYVFFKSFEDVEYNLMFVQDNYNTGLGWYLLHNDQLVDEKIAMAIRTVLTMYNQDESKSVIFGSSKGAYGAILLGQHLHTEILAQYPIYNVMRRYKLNKTDDYKVQYENLVNKNQEILAEKKNVYLTSINSAIQASTGRLSVLVGVADDDTSQLLSCFNRYKTDVKLYANIKLMTHGQYSSRSKGQASAILNKEDLSMFNIIELINSSGEPK